MLSYHLLLVLSPAHYRQSINKIDYELYQKNKRTLQVSSSRFDAVTEKNWGMVRLTDKSKATHLVYAKVNLSTWTLLDSKFSLPPFLLFNLVHCWHGLIGSTKKSLSD